MNVHIINLPITSSQTASLTRSCTTDPRIGMASNSQNGQSTVNEHSFPQNPADASISTSDSSYPDPESVMTPYCYPEPGSIKAPRPAGTCGLGSSGSTVGGKDPTICPFVCGLCGGRFTRRRTVKAHFPRCTMKNGNPRGLAWDSDPSCNQTGPSEGLVPGGPSQNGK